MCRNHNFYHNTSRGYSVFQYKCSVCVLLIIQVSISSTGVSSFPGTDNYKCKISRAWTTSINLQMIPHVFSLIRHGYVFCKLSEKHRSFSCERDRLYSSYHTLATETCFVKLSDHLLSMCKTQKTISIIQIRGYPIFQQNLV